MTPPTRLEELEALTRTQEQQILALQVERLDHLVIVARVCQEIGLAACLDDVAH
jgi:hypothetical protein